jgi:hypothetical protein
MRIEDEDVRVTEALFAYVTQDPQLTSDLERHWRKALAGGRIEAAWVRLRNEVLRGKSRLGLNQHFPSDRLWYPHLADLCRERFGAGSSSAD